MTEIKTDINFTQLVADVACIKQAILGNGEPGLFHRVENLEKSVDEIKANMSKCRENQGKFCGFCAGCGMIVGGFLSWLFNNFWKG